jgi:hypothetical protein
MGDNFKGRLLIMAAMQVSNRQKQHSGVHSHPEMPMVLPP